MGTLVSVMTKGRTQNNTPKLGKHVDVNGECKSSRQDDSTSFVRMI